jgi:Domain of unknown function (DUF4139)/N-terminal domain of unknown function (DUF4140)
MMMKKISILIQLILCFSSIYAENKVPSTVKEVTVYPSGAKITSVADVKLSAGNNEIIFEKMPLDLNILSLQIKVKGSSKLIAANFRTFTAPNTKADASKSRILQDSLELLSDNATKNNIENNLLQQEEQLLLENQRKVGSYPNVGNNLSINDLKELSAYCKTRLTEIKNRSLELSFLQRKIQIVQDELRRKLNLLNISDAQTTGEIVLQLSSPIAQTTEIACVYLVSNASWTPIYDIRAESIEKPLSLVSKASIKNFSGLDWKNVILHLSSALPFANNSRPILSPKYIDFGNTYGNVQYRTNMDKSTLTGRLIDTRSGEALIGANIILSQNGQQVSGMTTDIDGNYIISAYPGEYDVQFSYVGYDTQTQRVILPANQRINMYIGLQVNNSVLEEAVVIGYGTQKKKDETGSISTLNMAQLPSIRIRGATSLATDYRLDGMKVEKSPAPQQQGIIESLEKMYDDEENFSETYDVKGEQTVLNNTKAQVMEYKTQDIPAVYEYHSVPKLDPSVFLLAKITDYGKYNLVNGNANIFYKDTYIGQSYIDTKNTGDTLLLSLGRDEDISIKRLKPTDLKSEKKFFSDSRKERLGFEIVVKNNKNTPIEIEILDQIPVSRNKEIVVTLDEKGGADYNETYGKLSWKLKIPERKNKTVRFEYSVKSPKSKVVN